ncbi:MAG: HAD hydrolase family protein [Alistipes sp.]|jgi:3-deoxy-D-manno-octulosonate 8-phosphate phosphatase (KDO 8-P phosphatase)|nr:HAD hydrolase family protein [Alistipes sp.]
MENFKEKLTRVEAFVFDVDGVFTDGGLVPLADGDFVRTYHARDGYAVTYAVSEGYSIYIITGGRGETLKRRFDMLKVTGFYPNVADKCAVLRELAEREGLNLANVVYMGDDIPDLGVMRMVGIPVCPADACHEIIDTAIYVSQYAGGKGCVRDIIEQVLRAKGDWLKHTVGMHTVKEGEK